VLFILLPTLLSGLINRAVHENYAVVRNLVEGVHPKIAIFMTLHDPDLEAEGYEARLFLPRRGAQDHPLLRGAPPADRRERACP
jgi:hypothetical protein